MSQSFKKCHTSQPLGQQLHFTVEDLPQLKHYSRMLCDFLNEFRWLIDAFVLDFFLKNHWKLIPDTWSTVLDNVTIEQIAHFLKEGQPSFRNVSPLSFLCFLKLCKTLPLSRQSIFEANTVEMDNYAFEDTKHPLTSAFKRHMKGKKRHEVGRLAKMASDHFENAHVQQVLDVGGGQGHLSRLLCFGYGLQVATLDAEGVLIEKAQVFDSKVTRDLGRLKYREKIVTNVLRPPVHLKRLIGVSTAAEDVAYATKNAWQDMNLDFGIIGLHTCGDLGPTMFRLFAESSQVKALVSVGCCYHKIHQLFPLSATLSSEQLSYEAKEVACHSIEIYVRKLLEENSDKGKIHSFRAALEVLIDRYHPELKHISLSTVKYVDGMTFEEYAPKALKKVAHNIPAEVLSSHEIKTYLGQWMRVATFFALRLCIAPTIETILQLDRVMYLLEAGHEVKYIPLFEPTVSPRCHVIAASKCQG